MRKTVKKTSKKTKEKPREYTIEELASAMSEMYLKCERYKTNDFITQYSEKMEEEKEYIQTCKEVITQIGNGTEQKKLQQNMMQLYGDYGRMREDAKSKFKIYVRGIGNAGKSTLVNTLLGVSEDVGSKMTKMPETFIIEAYSDSIPYGQALLFRTGDAKGTMMSRTQAKQLQKKELEEFLASEKVCETLLNKELKNIYDSEERKERTQYIFEGLKKTSIRQIVWGISENSFLKNSILVDTPGLLQELRHTNELEDVKNYEPDGMLWVLSQKHIIQEKDLSLFVEETKKYARLDEKHCMIAVVNVHSEDNVPGDKGWRRMEEQTKNRLMEMGILHCFRYVCYVNCKKAYEGKLENDLQKIKQSNIEQLQAIINEQFIEKNSQSVTEDRVRKYHDYMDLLKENLRQSIEKIEEMEEKYELSTSKINKAVRDLYTAFQNELDTTEVNHNSNMKNRLNSREEEMLEFETWSEEKKQQVLTQIAKLPDANQAFYQVYQYHIDKINKQAEKIDKQSIVSRYDIIGAEIYFKIHPMEPLAVNAMVPVSIPHYDFMGELQKLWIDFKGGVVEFFQGKEAKVRYMYNKKYKPQIENSLRHAVESLYRRYYEEIETNLEKLRVHCEDTRDYSFAEELGTIEDVREAKQKIQELLQEDTDFPYEEKNLINLLFEGETKWGIQSY